MTIKQFSIQVIRKTVIIFTTIAFMLWLSGQYLSTLPEGM